jgi:hypothetical protein
MICLALEALFTGLPAAIVASASTATSPVAWDVFGCEMGWFRALRRGGCDGQAGCAVQAHTCMTSFSVAQCLDDMKVPNVWPEAQPRFGGHRLQEMAFMLVTQYRSVLLSSRFSEDT